ncbi:MAG TPA: VOC family protein [Candidatus Saccharimonadales bacterium]|nr:VOC family protein [Candidatus Saccharimonadales bacterium]
MKIQRIDHIGIVVDDLAAAKEFFLDFGFTVQGEAEEQSELLDKVTGFKDSKSQIVFLQAPGGQINLELSKFFHPADKSTTQENSIYSHGIRHLAFVVENIEEIVSRVKQKGYDVFVDTYSYGDMYKLCYFSGPEGIIIELAEKL